MRPSEVDALIGDASRAKDLLGWTPKVLTPELARIMVDADLQPKPPQTHQAISLAEKVPLA